MTGRVTVTTTSDWLTPFEVEVAIDGRKPATAKFMAAAKAQSYALTQADENGLDLVYIEDRERGARCSVEDFAKRHTRVCSKCREAKPLIEFGPVYHQNQHKPRGRVFHGLAERCQGCSDGE